MTMKSTKPYLLEAMYRWMVDSQCSPLLHARTDILGVNIPEGYARDNLIILDVSEDKARAFAIDGHVVTFEAIFDEVIHAIRLPMPAILAIYAQENGMGMEFHEEDDEVTSSEESGSPDLRVL
jgi:stringent starvation protein B